MVDNQEQNGDDWRDSGQHGETATGAERVGSLNCIL